MYPTNDAAVACILATAKAQGRKVRVKGTGHSEPGIIVNKADNYSVVISLANYVPPAAWNGVLNTGSSPSVRIGAGRTYMDLMAIARPAGYVLHTTTAGFFFSVGGVVANPSVHGSAFASDRLNSHMSAAYVMLANGTTRNVVYPEIVNFRGSMGYLGVILAAQIDLQPDRGLQMNYFSVQFCGSSQSTCVNSWNGLQQLSQSGSVYYSNPINTPPPAWSGPYYGYGGSWSQTAINTYLLSVFSTMDTAEWFWNPYTDEIQALSMKFNGAPGFNYAATASSYATLQSQFPNLGQTGGQSSYSNSILASLGSSSESINLLRL